MEESTSAQLLAIPARKPLPREARGHATRCSGCRCICGIKEHDENATLPQETSA